ncbi:MAG: hypothetical protein IPK22_11255 [Verrucomicrobiaceae bacterium]|nr:hypothetical protein [Verrucomicrobiaceae bacterium]
MSQKLRQAREHRTSALNLRANAQSIAEENPDRAKSMIAEAEQLEKLAAKLDPAPAKPAA